MANDAKTATAKTAAIKKKVAEFTNFGKRLWTLYGDAGGKETLAQLSHEQQQKLHARLSKIYNELVQLGGHEGKTKADLMVAKVHWKTFSKDCAPFYNEQSRRNLLQEFQIEKEQANAHKEDDAVNDNSGRGRERDRRRRNHNSHHEDDNDRSRSRSKHHRPSNRNKSDNDEDDDDAIVGDYDDARKTRKRKNKKKKKQSKKQEEDDNDADNKSVCMSPLS